MAEPQAPTYPNPMFDTNLLPDYLSERLLGQECKALTLPDLYSPSGSISFQSGPSILQREKAGGWCPSEHQLFALTQPSGEEPLLYEALRHLGSKNTPWTLQPDRLVPISTLPGPSCVILGK